MNSYVRFAKANNITPIQLKSREEVKKGIYHIQQHVNSYHSILKRFMNNFNGVSTKYLNNYLIWNNFINYSRESQEEKRNILLSFVLTTFKTDRYRDLSNRPPIPIPTAA